MTGRPAFRTRTSIQSSQAAGIATAEAAMTRAVARSARPRARHSRRTANQRRPTPGVSFVRRTKAQVAGQRKPTTMAVARSSEMLPPAISIAATPSPTRNQRGPTRSQTAAMRIAVQTPTKLGQGSQRIGPRSWRKAGE
ncbi:MAG: hypothetical protein C4343_01505 [Chloroflexota bacterium]